MKEVKFAAAAAPAVTTEHAAAAQSVCVLCKCYTLQTFLFCLILMISRPLWVEGVGAFFFKRGGY